MENDPFTAYDPRSGDFWVGGFVADRNPRVLWVARKIPGADAFQDPAAVPDTAFTLDKPLMAAGAAYDDPQSTNLYIAYERGLVREGVVVASEHLGAWSDPRAVPGPDGDPASFIKALLPRVGVDGTLYITYWDLGDHIYLARSADGGQTWDPANATEVATRMDTWGVNELGGGGRFAGNFRVPPLAYLAVDTTSGMPDSGALYCVYFDVTDRWGPENDQYNVDLYFTKSTDEGSTWSTPTVINGDAFNPSNSTIGDQYFPWIEVDSVGNLHVVFYDTRDPTQFEHEPSAQISAYYLFSADGGETWDEFELTSDPFISANDGLGYPDQQFLGDYLGLATAGTTAYPCCPYAENTDPDIYMHVIEVRDGACCLPDDTCTVLVPRSCAAQGGAFIDYEAACGPDCNNNGVPDGCDLFLGTSLDCNGNGVPDECDLAGGTSLDCNGTGVPDECEGCAAGCLCGGGCYQCCTHAQCGAGQVCCGNVCRSWECCDDSDCGGATPYCLAATHECVECVDDSHCTDPEKPYCGYDLDPNVCVECNGTTPSQCPGLNCYCLKTVGDCTCCTGICPLSPGSE